jgi:cytochrome P450
MIPEELDPPEHTKYRQLLTPLFAPQKIEAPTHDPHLVRDADRGFWRMASATSTASSHVSSRR